MYIVETRSIDSLLNNMGVHMANVADPSSVQAATQDMLVKNPFCENHYLHIHETDGQGGLHQSYSEFCVLGADVPYTSYPQDLSLKMEYFYQQLTATLNQCGLFYERLEVNPLNPTSFSVLLYENRQCAASLYLLRYIAKYTAYNLGYTISWEEDCAGNALACSYL